MSAKPDVFKRASTQMAVNPKRKDPLIGSPELSGAGEHAAAVHEDRQTERFAVLQRQRF